MCEVVVGSWLVGCGSWVLASWGLVLVLVLVEGPLLVVGGGGGGWWWCGGAGVGVGVRKGEQRAQSPAGLAGRPTSDSEAPPARQKKAKKHIGGVSLKPISTAL
jgi:hypothetical protein